MLRMTVVQRDGAGNLIQRSIVKADDPRDLVISRFQPSHTLEATVEAEFRDGLERVWISFSARCWEEGGQVQTPGSAIPGSGNAIPLNQHPTKFSFVQALRVADSCTQPRMEYRVRAHCISLPSKDGGPYSVTTKDVVLTR